MSDQQTDDSSNVQFPWKLHLLLRDADESDFEEAISWLPGGVAFQVHDKKKFAEEIMPKYFSSNKFKSFQRNLNLWGFHTQTKEPNRGAIHHPLFLRGQADRCHLMKRVKIKKGTVEAQALPLTQTSLMSNVLIEDNNLLTSLEPGKPNLEPRRNSGIVSISAGSETPPQLNIPASVHSILAACSAQQQSGLIQPTDPSSAANAVLTNLLLAQQAPAPVNPGALTGALDPIIMQHQQHLNNLCQQVMQATANINAIEKLRSSLMTNALVAAQLNEPLARISNAIAPSPEAIALVAAAAESAKSNATAGAEVGNQEGSL